MRYWQVADVIWRKIRNIIDLSTRPLKYETTQLIYHLLVNALGTILLCNARKREDANNCKTRYYWTSSTLFVSYDLKSEYYSYETFSNEHEECRHGPKAWGVITISYDNTLIRWITGIRVINILCFLFLLICIVFWDMYMYH